MICRRPHVKDPDSYHECRQESGPGTAGHPVLKPLLLTPTPVRGTSVKGPRGSPTWCPRGSSGFSVRRG